MLYAERREENMSLFESILYGLISGFAEFLPVSSQGLWLEMCPLLIPFPRALYGPLFLSPDLWVPGL